MARGPIFALIAGAAALAWSAAADAQQQQRQRQPRGTPQPAPRAQPAPAPQARPAPAPAPAPAALARVQTDPPGAACQVVGAGGQSLSRVFGTPEAVPLASRAGGEQVVCNMPGFLERRAPLAAAGQTTTLALALDPRSKVVNRWTVDPGVPLRQASIDRLIALQTAYRAGKVPERRFFAERLHIIAADSDLPPDPRPAAPARAAAPRPAPRS